MAGTRTRGRATEASTEAAPAVENTETPNTEAATVEAGEGPKKPRRSTADKKLAEFELAARKVERLTKRVQAAQEQLDTDKAALEAAQFDADTLRRHPALREHFAAENAAEAEASGADEQASESEPEPEPETVEGESDENSGETARGVISV